jgi:hypothetical protein
VLKSVGISVMELGEKMIVTKSCELLLDAFHNNNTTLLFNLTSPEVRLGTAWETSWSKKSISNLSLFRC